MVKIIVNDKIWDRIEPLHIGIISCRGISNHGQNDEIARELSSATMAARAKFEGTELAAYPLIRKWRDIYKSFGEKKSRSSVESLIRRIVNGKVIPSINPLVDLYNITSIKYEMPAGGEDLDVITADMELTFADGTEEFICLGETEVEHPNPNEIVYKFGNTVVCRNFNYRESDLTEDTENALIVLEYVNADDPALLQEALRDLSGQIQKFLGGDTKIFILSKESGAAILHDNRF